MSIPSTPTTPTAKLETGSGQSTPNKRKLSVFEECFNELGKALENVEETNDPEIFVQTMRDLYSKLDGLTPTKKAKFGTIIWQASTFKSETHVAELLGIEYRETSAYLWEPPSGDDVKLSSDADSLLDRIINADFWRRDSAESLSRTLIDIVLFDRMSAHQEKFAARKMVISGEHSINTKVRETHMITGKADYVIGYRPTILENPKHLESISVIVEAKRNNVGEVPGLPQAVAYMAGVQQHRRQLELPKRIVDTTYGIISNGTSWIFARLSGNKLLISPIRNLLEKSERSTILRYVDAIISASIELSPHTTPQHNFPSTQERWERNVESPLFGRGLQYPDSKGEMDNVDYGEDLEIERSEDGYVKLISVQSAKG